MSRAGAQRPYYRTDTLTMINEDVLRTRQVAPSSVNLVVTSPPYNVDVDYGAHDDGQSYSSYLDFSRRWLSRCLDWLREDGRLCLLGRATDVVNILGAKIATAPIERALQDRLGTGAVCLLSFQDEGTDDELHVVIESRQPVDRAALEAAARAELHLYPRAHFHVFAELPRNAMGKVPRIALRRLLRERLRPARR